MSRSDFYDKATDSRFDIDASNMNWSYKKVISSLIGQNLNQCIQIMFDLINDNIPIIIQDLPIANYIYLIKHKNKDDDRLYKQYRQFYDFVEFYESLLEVEYDVRMNHDNVSVDDLIFRLFMQHF
jgi:hypothetical protein